MTDNEYHSGSIMHIKVIVNMKQSLADLLTSLVLSFLSTLSSKDGIRPDQKVDIKVMFIIVCLLSTDVIDKIKVV